MIVEVGNKITITDPPIKLKKALERLLSMKSKKYVTFSLYKNGSQYNFIKNTFIVYVDNKMIVPFGLMYFIRDFVIENNMLKDTEYKFYLVYDRELKNPLFKQEYFKLRDYQEEAVSKALDRKHGVLVLPTGAGKTVIGLTIANRLKHKALWITHTKDLLKQAYTRTLEMFQEPQGLGIISDGKIELGEKITFATIQSLAALDLVDNGMYQEFGTVIVNECHRVGGSEDNITMFYKVLSSLSASYKFGLTATFMRSDNTEMSIIALLGDVFVDMTEHEEVHQNRLTPIIREIPYEATNFKIKNQLNMDSSVDYINHIAYDEDRCRMIAELVDEYINQKRTVLVLCDRVGQIDLICSFIKSYWFISMHGNNKQRDREYALDSVRRRENLALITTSQLAREGLDISCLEVLIMANPQQNEVVITQAVGRIVRVDKNNPNKRPEIVDIIDKDFRAQKIYLKRKAIYQKLFNS